MKITLIIIAAILSEKATTATAKGCNGFNGIKVRLIADDCGELTRCKNCGPELYPDAASVDQSPEKALPIWTLEEVGKNKCAIKADNGRYAGICRDCWEGGRYPYSVFVNAREPYEWNMEKQGKYFSFEADTGEFMARCILCVRETLTNFAFVYTTSPTGLALWEIDPIKNDSSVEPVTTSKGCNGLNGKKVYLIADNGKRLSRCNGCGPGSYPDSASVHGIAGDSFAMWTLEEVGQNKCALKADSGRYAARCNGCWRGTSSPDSVFVHAQKLEGAPYAQWTMERQGDKFSFKADTGKYMARCNSCVNGGAKSDFAFVHVNSLQNAPYALWTVVIV